MSGDSPAFLVREGGLFEVLAVDGGGALTLGLLEMGLVTGTSVEVIKRAPLGDPLELRVRGYHLSLRRAEATRVEVTRDP